jgi:hypothetical protein
MRDAFPPLSFVSSGRSYFYSTQRHTPHTHTHNRCGAENKWLDAFASNSRVRRDATLFLSVVKIVSRYIPSFNKQNHPPWFSTFFPRIPHLLLT